jgi:glucose/arabinose dehydrogenase
LRNPWRWSFDKVSGELWVADVGQDSWEEVDKLVLGGNYGWRCREGAHAFNASCGQAQNLIDPVAEYSHSQGQSITGGFVYRGTAIAGLAGRFVFGDFVSGNIWSVARDTPPTLALRGGFSSGLSISSFAQEANGELLVIDYGGGLHRLIAGNGAGSSESIRFCREWS